MFHRRRASSNVAPKSPPSTSASLAATKAFIRDRNSNASLSSAAASAALRTHATSPTLVGDTITKRMVRKSSTSSHGSGSHLPPGLRRHSSSGSMTERSFRAPSPARNSPIDHTAPPVPTVPKDVPGVGVMHRRAISLEPPYRGASSAARRGGGRGVSLDRGVVAEPGHGKGHTPRVTSLSQVPEDEQDGSPRSVNFSRPMSPSQPVASARNGQSGWFGGPVVNTEQTFRGSPTARPKTSDGVSGYDVSSAQQAVQNAAARPVSTKRSQMSHAVEGARLSTGSMRVKPSGSSVASRPAQAAHSTSTSGDRPRSVDPKSPYAVYDPSTRTFIHKQDAMAKHRELSHEDEDPAEHYVNPRETPARPHHPPQQWVPQQQSSPARNVMQRTPSPPPQYVQRAQSPPQQARERTPTPPTEHALETEHEEERPSTPPLTSYAQTDALLARRTSEDYAGLDIKPSVDANTSRKSVSNPPEIFNQPTETPISPKLPLNLDSPYPRIGTPVIPAPSNTVEGKGRGSVRGERTNSLSPPRNAHFAAVAVEPPNGVKHAPPLRSVSPAKSALKHSPSVSRRNSSPPANNARLLGRGAPSEASDTMSENGTKKKKKNVRVSFDEDPVIAGTSAYADDTPSSPTGLSASRWSSANQERDLDDDVLRPRPALPSFGSIRDKNRRHDEGEVPEKVTETVSSSLSTSVGSIGEVQEASSDHALGGILAQDFVSKQPPQSSHLDPLAPEVTSVEGSGYVSDSDQSDTVYSDVIKQESRNDEPKSTPEQSVPMLEPKTLTTLVESSPPAPEVPVIAIQPASPGPIERPEPKFQRPFVPGGWDEDEEPERVDKEKIPQPSNVTPAIDSQASNRLLEPQVLEDDSSDDNSSIYSDAYEDLENEGGGFASIDAVVESPTVGPSSGLMSSKYADTGPEVPAKSSLRHEVSGDVKKEQGSNIGDWDAARQHWSVLNDARKQHKSEEPLVEPATHVEPVTTTTVQAPKPKSAKTPTARKAQVEPVSKASSSLPVSQQPRSSAQPRKSALKKTTVAVRTTVPPEPQMRKTMRANAGAASNLSSETHMRKSMRASAASEPGVTHSPETHMRRSMRTDELAGASRGSSGLAASRHSISPIDSRPPKGTLQKKHLSTATTAAKARPQTASGPITTKAVPAYDSDSDASVSSFRRERPRTSQGENGRYTMRSSMRSGPAPTMRATPTMRPTSPPERTPAPATALRKSMRPSSPQAEPTSGGGLKSSKFSIRSLSPAGRFRPARNSMNDVPPLPTQTSSPKRMSAKIPTFGKPSKPKAPATSGPKSRFKSRFADSSDEDEDDRPRRFQSRFADSDDDDEDFQLPTGLAPVRGIPRKPGEDDGDSTDLEEEASDSEPSPSISATKNIEMGGRSPTNGTTNGQGTRLTAGSLRDSKHATELPTFETGKKPKAKRGFFGLGKKKAPIAPQPTETESALPTAGILDIPLPPEHRNRNRPLTPIGEGKAVESGEPTSRSPKLQRRSTPQWGRSVSDSWPLPQPPKIGEEARPQSSDGMIPRRTSLRPALNKRYSSQISEARTDIDPKSGKEVIVGRTGKKKKFQGLRRVFGLND